MKPLLLELRKNHLFFAEGKHLGSEGAFGMGAGATRAAVPPLSPQPSPPHVPHPSFVPVLIIALLLFSVTYNSGIFYNIDLFFDTRFLYKDLYIK